MTMTTVLATQDRFQPLKIPRRLESGDQLTVPNSSGVTQRCQISRKQN